jgi:EAL domain-containing protein (putative c-di-GMP-specific phosphodiesterase class I)
VGGENGLSAEQEVAGGGFPVAVNISARQLQQSDFVEMIELILDDTDLESHLLELELTESATMQNLERSSSTTLVPAIRR